MFRLIASLLLAIASAAAIGAGADGTPRPGANIALGKRYTISPTADYPYCTDGREAVKLTDGVYSQGYFWTQKATVGWRNARPALVTVDLGKSEAICGASFNTAAGCAGVEWPTTIDVLVSDDGRLWWPAGDLVALGATNGMPPEQGYAVHRFWTDKLRCHGRFVAFQVDAPGGYTFCDEIEVYAGSPELLRLPRVGAGFSDLGRVYREQRVTTATRARIRQDAASVRGEVGAAPIAAARRAGLLGELAAAEREALGWRQPVDFRAILPFGEAHGRIFAVRAALWRACGQKPVVWQNCPWDPIDPRDRPAGAATPAGIEIVMLGREVRSAVLNVTWPGDHPLRVHVRAVGLPGGSRPGWLAVREAAWTATAAGRPTASALPEAVRDGDGWVVEVLPGMTRQIWLSVDSSALRAGLHRGAIALSAGSDLAVTVPCSLRVSRIRMPKRLALSLGGWDYTDGPAYGITPANVAATVAFLREYHVDTPWALPGTMPFGRHDVSGAMLAPPDTASMDRWLRLWKGARFFFVFVSVSGELPDTPAAHRRVSDWIGFWVHHMKTRGIRASQFGILLVDEPGNEARDRAAISYAKVIRAAQPDVIVFEDPTWRDPRQASPDLYRTSTMLCPNRVAWMANRKVFEEVFLAEQEAGRKLAFYSCSGPVRSMDPYAYYRLQAWDAFRYGAVSEAFWAFGDTGGGSSWNEYAAPGSDYAPEFLGPEGCVTSKQMEGIREGLFDYETLSLLRRAADAEARAGRHTPIVAAARRLLREGPSEVTGAPGVGGIRWEEARDRSIADQVRRSAITLLDELTSN